MGMTNQPMGMAPQAQPTLQSPLQLPQNPQPQMHPQLPSQPNPNPNNRITQLVQIIENLDGEINSVGCNELQLRLGHIISPEENKIHQEKENENIQPTMTPSNMVIMEEIKQRGNTVEPQNFDEDATPPPLFPEKLMIENPTVYANFYIVGELKNFYFNIPLLQALQDIPIYAKTIKELCEKKHVRKAKNPSIVCVVGALSDLILGKQEPVKNTDPGNPMVKMHIHGCYFPNTLVDLGEPINILTIETCNVLGFTSFEPTSIMLQLVDRSLVKPFSTLQDIEISVDSWEYPADFLIINPRSGLDGNPLILGRPWLETRDAYI
jgi:hypothetical protein